MLLNLEKKKIIIFRETSEQINKIQLQLQLQFNTNINRNVIEIQSLLNRKNKRDVFFLFYVT